MTGRDLDRSLGRGYMGDGAATMLAGAGGGSGTTTYAENIGVMAATRVYSTAAYIVAGLTAIALGMIPKFGALIVSIPVGVLGGATIILYGLIAVLGGRIWVEARVDFKNPVNLFPAAVGLILGAANATWTSDGGKGDISFNGIAIGTFATIIIYQVMRYFAKFGVLKGAPLTPAVEPQDVAAPGTITSPAARPRSGRSRSGRASLSGRASRSSRAPRRTSDPATHARAAGGHRIRHQPGSRRHAVTARVAPAAGGGVGRRGCTVPRGPRDACVPRRCACCWTRVRAAALSRWCLPTGWSQPSTRGCRRCRSRARRRSSAARPTARRSSRPRRACVHSTQAQRNRRPDRRGVPGRPRTSPMSSSAGSAASSNTSRSRCCTTNPRSVCAKRYRRYRGLGLP